MKKLKQHRQLISNSYTGNQADWYEKEDIQRFDRYRTCFTDPGDLGRRDYVQNRQATELIIQARNEERQKAEAESQTAAEEEIGIAPGQKEELTADPRDLNLVPILAQDQLTYKGKNYRRNQYVKAILCMGVDRSDTMTETKELGLAGQSDGIFLIAQDTARPYIKDPDDPTWYHDRNSYYK